MSEFNTGLAVKNVEFISVNEDGGRTPLLTILDAHIEYTTTNNNSMREVTYTKLNHLRCGSRKRFVKLLMANGFQRNDAQALSKFVMKSDLTYGQFWRNFWLYGPVYLSEFKLHKDDKNPAFTIKRS